MADKQPQEFELTEETLTKYKNNLYIKKHNELYLRVFNNTPEEASVPGILDVPKNSKDYNQKLADAKKARKELKRVYSNMRPWRTDTKEDTVSFKIVQSKNKYIDISLSYKSLALYRLHNDNIILPIINL